MNGSLLETLFNHLPDWVLYKDADGVCQFCNDALVALLGCSRVEIIGQCDRTLPPALHALLAQVDSDHCEQPLTDAAGQTQHFQIQTIPIADLAGVLIIGRRLPASSADVALLQSIYAGAETPIFAVDVEAPGQYTFASFNPVAERNMQVSPGTLVGKKPNPSVCTQYDLCCHSRQPFVYEEHLQFQGQDTWWLTTLNPLQNASGEIYRLVGTTIDITRRCEAEQTLRHQATELQKALTRLRLAQSQLVQSEKMSSLGQLVAGIAHEVNNPISFIFGNIIHAQDYIEDLVGLIRLYRRTYPQATPAIETHIQEMDLDYTITDLSNLLGSMMTGAKRIHTIMQSLRDFSRLDEVGQKSANLHHGIDSTLMVLQNRLHGTTHRSDIKVVKNYGEIPPVVCYPRQLNQVFLNVLTNAIDALDGHYHRSRSRADAADLNIQIQTRAVDAGRVQVSIRDSGPGISAEHCAIVFDPFFTTKAVGHGTGMGLAIAYQIVVQQHGGQMTARVPEEGGTEISLEIPIQSQ